MANRNIIIDAGDNPASKSSRELTNVVPQIIAVAIAKKWKNFVDFIV